MEADTTVIFTAVTEEAAPLRRTLRLERVRHVLHEVIVYQGVCRGKRVAVVVTGMGREHAAAVAGVALEELSPNRVIICGTAGSASPSMRVGQVIVPAVVIDEATGMRYAPTLPSAAGGVLCTAKELVKTAAEKARYLGEHHADAVDMETAAIAALCDERKVPWACVRGISDGNDQSLPGFVAGLVGADGKPRVGKAVASLARNPLRLVALLGLARRAKAASRAAADRAIALL
jgi:adenosylhomocysteine nucleosidase